MHFPNPFPFHWLEHSEKWLGSFGPSEGTMCENRGAIPLILHSQLLNQDVKKKKTTLSHLSLCTWEIHFAAIEPEP